MNFALILFVLLAITGRSPGRCGLLREAPGEGRQGTLVDRISEELLPVILIVFLLRSFLVEPFKIPSGSMVPTLVVAISSWSTSSPTASGSPSSTRRSSASGTQAWRRDGVSFPEDPSLDYIKRVIAFPATGRLREQETLDQRRRPAAQAGLRLSESRRIHYSAQFIETVGGVEHAILLENDAPARSPSRDRSRFGKLQLQ